MGVFTLGHKFYLVARGAATTLSLLFALYYSRELGVLNRSYLVMIMTSSTLIAIALTSGTTLTLRNLPLERKNINNISSFNALIIIEMLIGILLFFIALQGFSNLKTYLHPTLILIAIFYFILSLAHLVSFELLIVHNSFKTLAFCEVLTIIIQISFFILCEYFLDISIASRLLLSFIFSYLIISLFSYLYLHHKFAYTLRLGDPLVIFKQSKGNHTIGTVLGIIDRFDRIIIAWILPIVLLGKYAVMSSFIAFFRFVPDTLAKLMVSTKSESWRKYLQPKLLLVAVLALLTIMVSCSQSIISFVLGPEWLLPWGVSLVYALQEFARGAFQLTGNYKVTIGNSFHTHRAALTLLLTAGPASFILALRLGVIGVPLGFLLSYLGVLLYLRRRSDFA